MISHQHHHADNDPVIQQILNTVGIASCPMDPKSMVALQAWVKVNHVAHDDDVKPSAAVSAVSASGHKPQDWQDMMEFQTHLLLEMQRQMQYLTHKVECLEQHHQRSNGAGAGAGGAGPPPYYPPPYYPPPPQQQRYPGGGPPPPVLPVPPVPQQQQQADAVIAAEPYVMLRPLRSIWDGMVNSRIVAIVQAFRQESQGNVLPMDGPMMFKVVFMMLVILARTSHFRNKYSPNPQRMYLTIALMVIGFLWHAKYLQFCYQFFYQDNVPYQIWTLGPQHYQRRRRRRRQRQQPQNENNNNDNDDDESGSESDDSDDESASSQEEQNNDDNAPAAAGARAVAGRPRPGPPRQQQQQQQQQAQNNNNNNNNDNGNGGVMNYWRNTFWAGAIQPGLQAAAGAEQDQQDQERHPPLVVIMSFFQDILYLLGSFLFSIFPMWRPEGPPPPPARPVAAVEQQEEEEEDQEQQPQQPQQQNNHNNNNHGGIPQVPPPRDAMEAADDDDDDDDD